MKDKVIKMHDWLMMKSINDQLTLRDQIKRAHMAGDEERGKELIRRYVNSRSD